MAQIWPMRRQLFVFAVLIAASVGLWFARDHVTEAVAALQRDAADAQQRSDRGAGQPAVPVIVARVVSQPDTRTITALGTARAQRAVMLTALANGRVVRLDATAGQRVAEGTELFTIDDTQAKLEAQLARKRLEDAERALNRNAFLRQRRVSSGARVEDAESALRQARLEVEKAEKALRDLTVHAPFAGVVGIPKVEPGDRVEAGAPVLSLDDRSTLTIEFALPERFLPRVSVGDRLDVTTPGFPNRTFSGTIASIDSRIDAVSRTVLVRARVPNSEDLLRPGMSFAVRLHLPGPDYAAVPELALQWRGGESFVWVVENEMAKRVTVTAMRRRNQTVLIDGAVSPGDLIVVEGVQRLRANRAVSYTPPADLVVTPSARRQTSGN